MSSWVLLRPFLLKACLSFVIKPFKQAQKPNISLAFFKHRRQAQKGFTEERCEPTVAIAKNHRSIRSDSEESLWRLRSGPDIPLCYRIDCSRSCHILKALTLSGNSGVSCSNNTLCNLIALFFVQPIVNNSIYSIFTLCWAEQLDHKGCLGQPLLSKSPQTRL